MMQVVWPFVRAAIAHSSEVKLSLQGYCLRKVPLSSHTSARTEMPFCAHSVLSQFEVGLTHVIEKINVANKASSSSSSSSYSVDNVIRSEPKAVEEAEELSSCWYCMKNLGSIRPTRRAGSSVSARHPPPSASASAAA